MTGTYDAVVVGSGIGGLMAAAALGRAGQKVLVLERLSFVGGRYTSIDVGGYAVTTGAWTSMGARSNIGRFCSRVGAGVRYVTLRDLRRAGRPFSLMKVAIGDGRSFCFNPFPPRVLEALARPVPARLRVALVRPFVPADMRRFLALFSDWDSVLRVMMAAYYSRRDPSDDISAREFLRTLSTDELLPKVMDCFAGTASGLTVDTLPAGEFVRLVRDLMRVGLDFGYPVGGVRSIVEALAAVVKECGGEIRTKTSVARIVIEGRRATGVEVEDGPVIRAKRVVHNAGARALLRLAGEENLPPGYGERIRGLKPVECGAIIVGSRRPLVGDAAMLLPPDARRVVGIFEPTFFDATVAPRGRHMVDVFFPFQTRDVRRELELAMADLRDLFPDFDGVAERVVPMVFRGEWPAAECAQTFGQAGEKRLDPVTPVESLYLVGMDAKGSGVAGDLIPVGVERALSAMGVR